MTIAFSDNQKNQLKELLNNNDVNNLVLYAANDGSGDILGSYYNSDETASKQIILKSIFIDPTSSVAHLSNIYTE